MALGAGNSLNDSVLKVIPEAPREPPLALAILKDDPSIIIIAGIAQGTGDAPTDDDDDNCGATSRTTKFASSPAPVGVLAPRS